MQRRGFTLFEILIVISITSILGLVAYNFGVQGLNTWRYSTSRAQSQEQVRRAVDTMISVIREARPADNGSYALSAASATSLTFYANSDSDSATEQVTFALNGTTLERRTVQPTSTPVQYTAAPTITTVVPNVRGLIFDYFDENYSGTGSPLSIPVNISLVRLVRVTVTVDDNPSKPPAAVVLSNIVNFRNLKDNL
jgi:prepilin-type N-terminal cleavage/methylation domain-containing protein